jgi:hypothetical protein
MYNADFRSFLTMTSKPTPPHDDPAESKRFIDMAREVEADEGDEAMDKAFKKIIQPPHHQETLAKS